MKLASLKNGSRDGVLVVVSRDLERAVPVPHVARTMQEAIERWTEVEPKLQEIYRDLCAGRMPAVVAFDAAQAESPLPRSFQWLDGSAYLSHVELVRQARGVEMAKELYKEPLMYQGDSEYFVGPRDPILAADEGWGIDLEGEVAVIVDDVPMQVTQEDAGKHIKLFMLVNDISLRHVIPAELNKGFGFLNGKGQTAFSPVAVTPDEFGSAWNGRKLDLSLTVHVNGRQLGQPKAGVDMYFDFPTLIAHATKTRPLGAGTVIGSGTISNHDRSNGFACLSEARALETVAKGAPSTSFMKFGDSVRIEMFDDDGRSIFGAIDQRIERYVPARAA
ncbi:fumarylacetoacetate hydrolase family protein [Noviherbaspirillum denitrificans]|uniref:2-keto-4-pentenoate hydratase n=1 Tax=Noviherbaspirillum denitrificans TaxID=1968433 RepID=A0A254THM4_9BURK|nr:fumarylacetoacetate hydrolase family protein [Noviherbaspirillum denitrificans]OWW20812.1 2-keto-4-pentenoate hydratase [Noviherbaspirillum denitrificans]